MATRLELMSFDKSRSVGNSEPAETPQVERKLSGGISGLRVESSKQLVMAVQLPVSNIA